MKTNKDARTMDLSRFTIEMGSPGFAYEEIESIRNDISKLIAQEVHGKGPAVPHPVCYQQCAPRP